MNSAVRDMSVADVRKALQCIRQKWYAHCPDRPICIADIVFREMTVERFAFVFALSHHLRRHEKVSSSRQHRRKKSAPRAFK